jgi:hypothetical protein
LIESHPLYLEFLDWIPFFNLAWRKLWVDVCQTSYNIAEHPRLRTEFDILYNRSPPTHSTFTFTRATADLYSGAITASPLFASICVCHLRSESTSGIDDGSDQVLIDGIWKEINAGQNQRKQVISFESLFNPFSKVPWGPNAPLTESWRASAILFGQKLSFISSELQEELLYPAVQRTKNMAQGTCSELFAAGYRTMKKGCMAYSTVDLERHYHETGQKIGGENEMRWAWRYNDLKPRCYYCTGGRSYWVSRYMKPVAVKFMNCLPITSKGRRSFPEIASTFVEPEDWVVIWDYSSFTTSLVELRQFLFWSARYIEHESRGRDRPLRLFDYRLGIVEKPLWEMLDEYNEIVNVYSRFSIHRLLDDLGLDNVGDVMLEMTMMNSGPLGVHGNIGFSTTVGGVHTAAKVKHRNAGVGMGDDILGITDRDPMEPGGLVEHAQDLGDIPLSKFGSFGPVKEGDNEGWKFVKRPLRRTHDGFSIGTLLAFPILAYVFDIQSRNRKFPLDLDEGKTIHRFLGQVGAFLWDLQMSTLHITDDDLLLIHNLLIPAYEFLGLPRQGSLPGYRIHRPKGLHITLGLCCPSIAFELYSPIKYEWTEYLWDRSNVSHCILPIKTVAPINILEYVPGKIMATSTKFNRVWVDLGYLIEKQKMSEVVEVTESNLKRFKSFIHGEGHNLVYFEWVRRPPEMYFVTASDLSYMSSIRPTGIGSIASLF